MRHEEVVITAWRLSGDLVPPVTACTNTSHCAGTQPGMFSGDLVPQTACTVVTHATPPVCFSFTSPHADDLGPTVPHELDICDKQLTRIILDVTSKTLTAMKHCASLLPSMCVLVRHLDDCCVRWTRTKVDAPVDAIYITETTSLLESLTGTSTDIDNLYIDIVSLASTLERFKSDRVRVRGTEEVAISSQLHILDAQFALLSKQVSAVGDQMDRLPNVDLAATRLREWATQFAMVSNLVHVLEGVVMSVLGISSGLIASLKEDTGRSEGTASC